MRGYRASLLREEDGPLQCHFFLLPPAPATPLVYYVLDAGRTQLQAEAADSGGTRHRAAYRLCQAGPVGQAIIVSQDGGLRLVCQRGRRYSGMSLRSDRPPASPCAPEFYEQLLQVFREERTAKARRP